MRSLVGALLAMSCACGARSALEVPPRDLDGGAIDRPAVDVDLDAPCADGPIPLRRRESVALLAIDRSGSMDLDLLGGNGVPRRWDVMRAVLPDALAALDPDVSLGAMLFPPVGAAECAAPRSLDVTFGEARAESVARMLNASRPDGRTPTYATLVQAERLAEVAAANLEQAAGRYEQGAAALLELVDAQAADASARIAVLRARLSAMTSRAQLLAATGDLESISRD